MNVLSDFGRQKYEHRSQICHDLTFYKKNHRIFIRNLKIGWFPWNRLRIIFFLNYNHKIRLFWFPSIDALWQNFKKCGKFKIQNKTTKRKLPTPREKEQTKNWNETKQDKRHKNRKIIKLRTFKKNSDYFLYKYLRLCFVIHLYLYLIIIYITWMILSFF